MNRRGFLKAFVATTAVAAGGSALLGWAAPVPAETIEELLQRKIKEAELRLLRELNRSLFSEGTLQDGFDLSDLMDVTAKSVEVPKCLEEDKYRWKSVAITWRTVPAS